MISICHFLPIRSPSGVFLISKFAALEVEVSDHFCRVNAVFPSKIEHHPCNALDAEFDASILTGTSDTPTELQVHLSKGLLPIRCIVLQSSAAGDCHG